MSKKFKSEICVYCNRRQSTTADHVFARGLFLVPERNNLIKVPSCKECNNDKSKLEHYLVSVLPFGGRHRDSEGHLAQLVPKRLERNQKLKRQLSSGIKKETPDENCSTEAVVTIPFDGAKYIEYWRYVDKGLVWHHFHTRIGEDTSVYAISYTLESEEILQKLFLSLRSNKEVSETVGTNTVKYSGTQVKENQQISMWDFDLYNGLMLSGGEKAAGAQSRKVFAITGPKALIGKVPSALEK
jgi:hypothetical protein